MSLKVSASDGVKVYAVCGGKNVPSWLSDKKQKSLRKDEEYRRRVELIQDFALPAACQRLKVSADAQYIFASGYHPPRVRVYDVNQLSMKFERHLDAEIVDFQLLSDDYSKAVFLCADRSLNFHARFGAYYKTRVPKHGRDLAFSPFTAEVLVAASAPEVYRLNLEEGRFLAPLPTRAEANNACGVSPAHGLLACAGDDGGLECFDLRQRASLGRLDAAGAAGGRGQGLTALRFDDSGMHVAVGTSGGLVALFDLRSQRPVVVKDHMYDSPIVDIKFHAGGGQEAVRRVISADRHVIKIWDAATGEGYTSIEPADGADINDVCVWRGSGLVMAACDASRIQAFFLPSLGPAPRWCSFLESLTEELEESTNPTVYDDYRFITRQDLEKLGLGHLVGTPALRAYMHGFFVDNRLYQKAKAIADPFAYETYRAKRVAQRLEDERKSRIALVRKLPKVNAATAARIMAEQRGGGTAAQPAAADGAGVGGGGKPGKGGVKVASLLEDARFKAMFEDPEFAIDERSEEYRLLHPNADPAKDRKLLREHFEELEPLREGVEGEGEEAGEDDGGEDDDDEGYSSEEEERRAARQQPKHRDKRLKPSADAATRRVRMFAARDDFAAAAYLQGRSLASEKERPLSERAAAAAAVAPAHARAGGNKEAKFVPRMRPDSDDVDANKEAKFLPRMRPDSDDATDGGGFQARGTGAKSSGGWDDVGKGGRGGRRGGASSNRGRGRGTSRGRGGGGRDSESRGERGRGEGGRGRGGRSRGGFGGRRGGRGGSRGRGRGRGGDF